MKIRVLLALISFALVARAQDKHKIILKDTIHLRGIVTYTNGEIAKNVSIHSKKYYEFLKSRTNENGYFELIPCLPNDTLIINHNEFPINKSRFIKVSIPSCVRDLQIVINVSKKKEVKKDNLVFEFVKSIPVFGPVENSATYPGGLENLVKTLKLMIHYPEDAIQNNIEGEVKVQFTVDTIGNVIKPILLKGIGYGCDNEVLNALLKLKKWNPGVEEGITRSENFTISYLFNLNNDFKKNIP